MTVSRGSVSVDIVHIVPPQLRENFHYYYLLFLWYEGWNPGPYTHWESDLLLYYSIISPQACYYFKHMIHSRHGGTSLQSQHLGLWGRRPQVFSQPERHNEFTVSLRMCHKKFKQRVWQTV